ncbi:MAG: cytochrome c oxidase subunit II, partial [Bacteroidia bacterium]
NPEYDYYLYCNKICGAAHYNMKIKITVVDNQAQYESWLAQQAPVVAPVEAPAAPVAPEAPAAPETPAVAIN